MTRKEAERRVCRAIADTMEGMGIHEFISQSELLDRDPRNGKIAGPDIRAEFQALIAELRRRGAELGVEPELESPPFNHGNLSDGDRKNRHRP